MIIKTEEILASIYTRIFLKEVDTSINIFLCGASTSQHDSVRDKIYTEIMNDSRFNVVFPEWLFGSLLNKANYNLLELEHLLAEDVDVIVIPLEGIGTIAELGAFATNKNLIDKIIIINKEEYKNSPGFINLGPIKLIKKNNKNNVFYFKDNLKQDDLENIIRRIKSLRVQTSKHELKNLFNLSRFIGYLIALFQPISLDQLTKYLKTPFLKSKISFEFIAPSLEILFRKGKIKKDTKAINNKAIELYYLSEEGHAYIYEDLLKRLSIIKAFCQVRAKILNYYNRKLNLKNINEDQLISRL